MSPLLEHTDFYIIYIRVCMYTKSKTSKTAEVLMAVIYYSTCKMAATSGLMDCVVLYRDWCACLCQYRCHWVCVYMSLRGWSCVCTCAPVRATVSVGMGVPMALAFRYWVFLYFNFLKSNRLIPSAISIKPRALSPFAGCGLSGLRVFV